MKKSVVFSALVCLLSLNAWAQQQTFILVRHAEKVVDGSQDPKLTEKGEKRANMLAEMMQYAQIDSILSTNYARTRATVHALAEACKKDIGIYAPQQQNQMLDGLQQAGNGKTFLIAGHSNTVPHMVNHLLQEQRLTDLNDDEYEKIFVVNRNGDQASLTILRYPAVN